MESERSGPGEPLTPTERQFLLDSGVPADSFDPQRQEAARASLRRRAEETRRRASSELTADQVASLLGASSAQVLAWVASRDLYAFAGPEGLRFPEWQFPDGQTVPGLRLVLSQLEPDGHPYSVEGLLATVAHEELGDLTAVDWLVRGGSPDAVVSLVISDAYGM